MKALCQNKANMMQTFQVKLEYELLRDSVAYQGLRIRLRN